MEIKIEVNEEQFRTLLNDSIEALPKEKLQEVILEGIKEFLINDKECIKRLVLTQYSGHYTNNVQPSQFLIDLMKKVTEDNKTLIDIRDTMIEHVRNNCNEVLHKGMAILIANSITSSLSFQTALEVGINNYLNNKSV